MSLLFSLKEEVGALAKVLRLFEVSALFLGVLGNGIIISLGIFFKKTFLKISISSLRIWCKVFRSYSPFFQFLPDLLPFSYPCYPTLLTCQVDTLKNKDSPSYPSNHVPIAPELRLRLLVHPPLSMLLFCLT